MVPAALRSTNYLGIANCQVTLGSTGISKLSATFAGDSTFPGYLASPLQKVSTWWLACVAERNPDSHFATPTATSSPTSTATSTPTSTTTSTLTSTSTATPLQPRLGPRLPTPNRPPPHAYFDRNRDSYPDTEQNLDADRNCNVDPNRHRDSYFDLNRDSYSNLEQNLDADSDSHGDSHCDSDRNRNSNPRITQHLQQHPRHPARSVRYTLTPPELDFGDCEIGQHGQTQTAFLFNPWWNNGTATISSISIQGSGDFSIDSRDTTCGQPHSELAGSAR